MITVKTPYRYVSAPDILKIAGKFISEIGGTALVIGGQTALAAAGESFFDSLTQNGIHFKIKNFSGYPSWAAINDGAALAESIGADVIVGVGGGKVMDTVKAVGQKTKRPVVTIPTIAATCAAWAAVSIIYDEEGSFVEAYNLDNSPRLVLLDHGVLANAPLRYLNAGIADTVAKWYEISPNLEKSDCLRLRLETETAALAMETIESKAAKVAEELKKRIISKDFGDIIDCIVLLAGLVGSTKGDSFFGGFAHPFYNSLTRIPETRSRLHGEKISFGLLTQAVIEGKNDAKIGELIALLRSLGQPVTLAELGIVENAAQKADIVAQGVADNLESYRVPDHKLTKDEIAAYILRADEIGRTA